MIRMINDWEKVTRSLIKHLNRNGYPVVSAFDGEESLKSDSPAKLAEHACACDEGWLTVIKGDERYRLYLVLGNEPFELVADWYWKEGMEDANAVFEKVLFEWSDMWEGKPCPKKERK